MFETSEFLLADDISRFFLLDSNLHRARYVPHLCTPNSFDRNQSIELSLLNNTDGIRYSDMEIYSTYSYLHLTDIKQ